MKKAVFIILVVGFILYQEKKIDIKNENGKFTLDYSNLMSKSGGNKQTTSTTKSNLRR